LQALILSAISAIDHRYRQADSNDLPWRQREIPSTTHFRAKNDLILAVIEAPTRNKARQAGLDLEIKACPQTDKFIWVGLLQRPFSTPNWAAVPAHR